MQRMEFPSKTRPYILAFARRSLGRVFKPFDPPMPPLKRGENSVKVPRDIKGS
jgi:hypothetical protein